MKFLSMLVFIALTTTIFAFMILRPSVEGNAMNLGIPEINLTTSANSDVDEIKAENSDEIPEETKDVISEESPEN